MQNFTLQQKQKYDKEYKANVKQLKTHI